jgi:hypothetical protein
MRLVIPLAIASLALVPTPAFACGGLFCSTAPVVQSGEEIVYALEDDGTLTMSVRLFYAGSDTDIAWVLPLPAVPELSTGSTALFTTLRAATSPLFEQREVTNGVCRPTPECVYRDGSVAPTSTGCGYSPYGSGRSYGGFDVGVAAFDASVARDVGSIPDGGVMVFSQASVGPYDTAVLGSTSAMAVTDWLSMHGYQLPAGTTTALMPYATTGHVFVGIRLAPGRSTSEIAPITMHMPVSAPCLPIRLTALATAADLPITAWFLGRARVVPMNFSVVTPNYDDERYWTQPGFYAAEMTREIDAAGGQAFVTEYAGPTPAMSVNVPTLPDATQLTPTQLVQELVSGTAYFTSGAEALRVLTPFVVPPSGQTLVAWLQCLSRGYGCADATSVDVNGLLAAVDSQIIAPARAAQATLASHPYLTRLYTTMSAVEMTLDPEFRADTALADETGVHDMVTTVQCDDSHYASDAPTTTSIGTHVLRSTPGTVADDATYCHSRNLYLPSEATPMTTTTAHGGLCGCRAGTRHGHVGALAVLAVISAYITRRRTRRIARA